MRSALLMLPVLASFTGCSEAPVWVAPPSSGLETALILYADDSIEGALVHDLTGGAALFMEELDRDARVEAALFARSISELGLAPGPVTRSSIERPLLARDAQAFFRLPLDADEPRWAPTGELSPSFADFPLPVRRADEPCPRFEQEVIVIEEPAFLRFGAAGPSNSLILSGLQILSFGPDGPETGEPRLYQLERDGGFRSISAALALDFVAALTEDGEGFWGATDHRVYSGAVRAGGLELEPVGSRFETNIRNVVGAATSSSSLYVMTSERPAPDPRPRRIYRFDGRDWTLVADVPETADSSSIAFRDGEAVLVNDGAMDALHIIDGQIARRPLPAVASAVQYVPGLDFVAGHRLQFMQFARPDDEWRVLAPPPAGASRVHSITPYEDGFLAVYDLAIAFWSPKLGAFCPLIDIPWQHLRSAHVIGQDVFVHSGSDIDVASIRAYALRRITD